MTNRDETSRHRLLDAIECIKNLEAVVSHCNEIRDAYYDAYMREDPELPENRANGIVNKYELCGRIKQIAIKSRRKIMKKIYNFFDDNSDHEFRCLFKHTVSAKQFIDEVDDATDVLFFDESQELYKMMSLAISGFLWEKPQTCARCLLDDLLSNDNEDDGTELWEE